jgi:hypothetical protein
MRIAKNRYFLILLLIFLVVSFTVKSKNQNEIQKKKCICGISTFSVLYNGDIIWCLNADRKNTQIYWNIKKDNIMDVWNDWFWKYRHKKFYNCNL